MLSAKTDCLPTRKEKFLTGYGMDLIVCSTHVLVKGNEVS